MSEEAFIYEAIRTPRGKQRNGALNEVKPVNLVVGLIDELRARHPDLDENLISDVILGVVSPVGDQGGDIARTAALVAKLPETTGGFQLNRFCASGLEAVNTAAQKVRSGWDDLVIAGGVESMSRVPMGTARLNQDFHGPSVNARYAPGLVPQGVSAEIIAARFGLSRHDLDVFSARSQTTAGAADFSSGIIPITVTHEDGSQTVVSADETIRPQTTVEGLGELRAVFKTEEYSARFPEIGWHVTAGNSSQLADGAAALLIMSEERAAQLGLTPRARFHAMAVASDDPITMLTGPIPATEKILKKTGMSISDFDHIEINEAFAPVPLAWRQHFDADLEKINPLGGAIAFGHPLGASGGRLLQSMLIGLEQTGGRYGFQSMCEAGGMANATIIERL